MFLEEESALLRKDITIGFDSASTQFNYIQSYHYIHVLYMNIASSDNN